MAWVPLPDCWKALLAGCCGQCDGIGPPPEGQATYCTIQNVSGCECLDGASFDPAFEGYDSGPGGYCTDDENQGSVWLFEESGSQGCGDTPLTLDHFNVACCRPISGSGQSRLSVEFQYGGSGHGGSKIIANNITDPSNLTVVSFTADPFELVIELDVDTTFSDLCNPGRLRFIFTRM